MKTIKRIIFDCINYIVGLKNGVIVFYNSPEQRKIIQLYKNIKKERDIKLTPNEAITLYSLVINSKKVIGDIAEVGVYSGGSSKLICESKNDKILHLFDTFEGLPEIDNKNDKSMLKKGDYFCSLENVKSFLKEYDNVKFYKGLFNDTKHNLNDKMFSLVHLDVDLYNSTLECLNFFYSRMNKGGLIISHDYNSLIGVKKAFDEFFINKPETIIELSGSQCLIIKI